MPTTHSNGSAAGTVGRHLETGQDNAPNVTMPLRTSLKWALTSFLLITLALEHDLFHSVPRVFNHYFRKFKTMVVLNKEIEKI